MRKADIPLLARAILAQRRVAAKSFAGIEASIRRRSRPRRVARPSYRLAGNSRELQNVLSRAAILATAIWIQEPHLDMLAPTRPLASHA